MVAHQEQLPDELKPANSPQGASFAFNQILVVGVFVVQSAVQSVWELIYPRVCVHCRRTGDVLCVHCRRLSITPAPGRKSELIDDSVAIGAHVGHLKTAVHTLKYENETRISDFLGERLAEAVQAKDWPFDMIIPVPMHATRLRERGYNQANIIAQSLGSHLNMESQVVADALLRTRATTSQVHLSAKERQENMKDAIAVAPAYQTALKGHKILLVDDVYTTGATLEACAVALRDAGVSSVWAATATQAQGTRLATGETLSNVC